MRFIEKLKVIERIDQLIRNNIIDLKDVILSLKVLTNHPQDAEIHVEADVNDNDLVGIEEALNALQHVSKNGQD